MRKTFISFAALAVMCLTAQVAASAQSPKVKRAARVPAAAKRTAQPNALATANFVYHEQTANFVATPTCPSGGTDAACGRYTENTDRSAGAGFQIFSPETYSLRFKSEFQFFVNQARVYYTTDGSNPSGSFGTPLGTTQVVTASFTCTYSDQTQGCQIVDVVTGAIPPQPVGTTVKYIVSAWHSGGGPEVFGNSGTCAGCFSCTDSTTGCATTFQYNVLGAPATPLVISEFRLRGLSGIDDEFVEIYNKSDSPVTVNSFDGSAGFALVASDGVTRFTIPNGTVIPARGHFLGVNSTAYSLGGYPAGNGTTATGDATYTTGIPDNAGIALFNTATPANFTLANRLDAAGSASEANTLYKEGTGYPALSALNIDHSFYRDLAAGTSLDTGDNNNDFLFVDTQGTCALILAPNCESFDGTRRGRHLGAPGPENLSSPIARNSTIKASLIDPAVSSSVSPNRVRETTPNNCSGGTPAACFFGTLDIRRKFTNNTGGNVTRLRFRIVDITTFPVPTGTADLRALTSPDVTVSTSGGSVLVRGTTLEEPPSQPNGGGFNSSLSAGTITLATPLAVGASINVRFLMGVQQTGSFRFFISVEALP